MTKPLPPEQLRRKRGRPRKVEAVRPTEQPTPERVITAVSEPPGERIQSHVDNYHEELEGLKPKRKSAKEERERSEEIASLKSTYTPFGRFAVQFAAVRMPKPIPATELELQMAEQVTDALIEKYFPLLKENGPELSALMVFGMIFGSRIDWERFFAKTKLTPKEPPAMQPKPELEVKPSMPPPSVPIPPNNLNELEPTEIL